MKKILIVAALVAASCLPATPGFAADMADMKAGEVSLKCIFLPLLPDCLKEWKAEADSMKAKVADMKAPEMPAMPAMPKCEKAAAGSGHLLDCK